MKGITKKIDISKIKFDMSINPRNNLDQSVVERYAEIINSMPDIEIFNILDEGYVLVAGFHRYKAHELNGASEISCKVYDGARLDAMDFADRSNAKNPLQLSDIELIGVCERALLRSPGLALKELTKKYGVSKKMAKDVRKKLEWEDNSFPIVREQEDYDVVRIFDDPLEDEKTWHVLHFANYRRKATLEERLTPCELCDHPFSQRCHLLDVAVWGENEFTRAYCVSCHEMFDIVLTTLESKELTRADILVKCFEKKRVREEKRIWYETISELAQKVATWRKFTLDERESQREHYRKNRLHVQEMMDIASDMGVK